MEALALRDFLSYRYLSELNYSPDGKRAAFAVSSANEEENSYESRLWLYENGSLRQLTDLGKERQYVWLDDRRLLFPAVRSTAEKKMAEKEIPFTSLYCLDVTGGEALPLLTLPVSAEKIRVLDQNHLAVQASIAADRADDYLASSEDRGKYREELSKDKDYTVLEEIPFWYNGAGIISGKRSALFLVTVNPFSIRRLTGPDESLNALDVRGDEILYDACSWRGKRPLKGFHIHACNWLTGETRLIAQDERYAVSDLIVCGKRLLLTATDGARHGLNENDFVYSLDTDTGKLTLERAEEYNMYNSTGSDCRLGGGCQRRVYNGMLYHTATREGNGVILRLDRANEQKPVFSRDGSVDCFDISPDTGRLLMVAMLDMRLQELYEYDPENDSLTRLSHFNDEPLKDKYIAKPQYTHTESAGLSIGGWVLYPKDYDPDKRYPAVLDIHGGPKTVYGPVFYHEMQVWANMGYFVFFCNPKGSDGRDNDFMDIFGDYGGTDYRNLMDFTDHVLAMYPQIDREHVCVTGGSYGGFMTNWIIGHTGRFCCAASQRSIANWTGFAGTSDIGYVFAEDQCKADLYKETEKLWRQSPLAYADRAVTPTLFIHSDQDYRCPMSEGLQMFTALRAHGVESRLCLFHGENHELSRSGKPLHRVRRLEEITGWFERFSRSSV